MNPNYESFQKHYEKCITFYKTDCSKKAECEQNANAVAEKFGKINHLVYSVAFFGSKSYDASESDWMTSLRSIENFIIFLYEQKRSVNVAGAGYMISACVSHMDRAEVGRSYEFKNFANSSKLISCFD